MPNLDVLRSYAVLLVLASHLLEERNAEYIGPWHISRLGELGVWLFFVHTCLVLLQSLERQPSPLAFYVRRLFRIYPLSIVAVLVCMMLRLTQVGGVPMTGGAVLANLFLVQNLTGSVSLPSVLWTLPLEVQMYVCLPLLFMLIRRLNNPRYVVFGWLAIVPFALQMTKRNPLHYVPYFLPGAIAYLGFRVTAPRYSAAWLGVLLAASTVVYALAPISVVGMLLAFEVGLLMPVFHSVHSPLVVAGARQIARYSYGVYLSHTIVLALVRRTANPSPYWLPLSLGLITLVSVIAYHAIEVPMIAWGKRLTSRPAAPSQTLAAAV